MLVRSIVPFYVGCDLITLGRVLNIDPELARIFISQGKCAPLAPEREIATPSRLEVAATVVEKPRRRSKRK